MSNDAFSKLPSSRLSLVKDYWSQRDFRLPMPNRKSTRPPTRASPDGQPSPWTNLSQWAGQKIKRSQIYEDVNPSVNEIALFPGWAARHYRQSAIGEHEGAFDIEVQISGYATDRRLPEFATRSQRAFLRLAKGYASLPKLRVPLDNQTSISDDRYRLPDYYDKPLQQIPALSYSVNDDSDFCNLEYEFQQIKTTEKDNEESSVEIDTSSSYYSRPPSGSSDFTRSATGSNTNNSAPSDLLRLHANLESRLQPFWSSALSSRAIRVNIFACPSASSTRTQMTGRECQTSNHGPLFTHDVLTTSDGSFTSKLTISWEDLCTHPRALHIAFGDSLQEHELLVVAELLPLSNILPAQSTSLSTQTPTQSRLLIPITHSPVRVISDIDDTVKLAGLLGGARAAFHNVFVKDLQDSVIPGMGQWYDEMWKQGVRFHYVSNAPFELLSVITEFLQVSSLPTGSVKLRSYAGRSLFNGLLTGPAIRKRAGVLEVLDSFPGSQFFLIGDSGEQDLELYASVAEQRPGQILGVFIRDVGIYMENEQGIEDPTGQKISEPAKKIRQPITRGSLPASTPPADALRPLESNGLLGKRPPPTRAMSETGLNNNNNTAARRLSKLSIPSLAADYFTPTRTNSPATLTAEPESYTSAGGSLTDEAVNLPFSASLSKPRRLTGQISPMSESERRKWDLQARVYRARAQIPQHIVLRIFRIAHECVEAREILDKLRDVSQRVGVGK